MKLILVSRIKVCCRFSRVSVSNSFSQCQNVDSEDYLEREFKAESNQPHQEITLSQYRVRCMLQEQVNRQDVKGGRKVQFLIVQNGLYSNAILADYLIRLFSSCGSLDETNQVFDKVGNPSEYTWAAIIAAHAKVGQNGVAFQLYERTFPSDIEDNKYVYFAILKACALTYSLHIGRLTHEKIISRGIGSDLVVNNSLIDMYTKCGSLEEAHKVFTELRNPDIVTWNIMIAGYAKYGNMKEARNIFDALHCPNLVSWGAIIGGYSQLGEGLLALDCYSRMQNEDIKPDEVIFSSTLKACGSIMSIEYGRWIHEQIIETGLELNAFVGSALVDMYAKCGSLGESRKSFDKLPNRNVVVWNALIAGYVQHGEFIFALECFGNMQNDGLQPNELTLSSVLKCCGNLGNLEQGGEIYNHTISSGLRFDNILGSTLVDMYAKGNKVEEACKAFSNLPTQNEISWGAIIDGCAKHGKGFLALQCFDAMQHQGIKPNEITFLSTLKACGSTGATEQGRSIHELIAESGLHEIDILGNALVDVYAKCNSLQEARDVFDRLPRRNIVSWGAMIAGYALHGKAVLALDCFNKMQQTGLKPDKLTFLSILSAGFDIIEKGRYIHEQIIESGIEFDAPLVCALVDMYAKNGKLEEACKAFNKMQNRDVFSWTAMIAGLAQNGEGNLAFEYLEDMEHEGILANRGIFIGSLKACSSIGAIEQGRYIHEQMINIKMILDDVVGSSLIDMYFKCGSLNEARKTFDSLPQRNYMSWCALISGYAQCNEGCLALACFDNMQQMGMLPDKVIFLSILTACGSNRVLEQVRSFHEKIIQDGMAFDISLGSKLVDTYAKCGALDEARKIFDQLPDRNVVSWGAMITGYAQHGKGFLALECFDSMQYMGVKPSRVTFLSSLIASSNDAIQQGRYMHEQVIEKGLLPELGSAIIDMYAKCGNMREAQVLFDKLQSPCVFSWGAMISGYGQLGDARLAVYYLVAMQNRGIKPNDVIFTSILNACSQAGLVDEGRVYLTSMREYHSIKPNHCHYNCMVHLLAHRGCFEEAEAILRDIAQPNLCGWMALLNACKMHGNMQVGRKCINEIELHSKLECTLA